MLDPSKRFRPQTGHQGVGRLGVEIRQALERFWVKLPGLKTTEDLVENVLEPLDLMQAEFRILKRPSDLLARKTTPHKNNTTFHETRALLAQNREYQSTRSLERQTRRGMWFGIKESVDNMKTQLAEQHLPSELFQEVSECPWGAPCF